MKARRTNSSGFIYIIMRLTIEKVNKKVKIENVIDELYPCEPLQHSEMHDYHILTVNQEKFDNDIWTFEKHGLQLSIHLLEPRVLFQIYDRLVFDDSYIPFKNEWIHKIEEKFRELNYL